MNPLADPLADCCYKKLKRTGGILGTKRIIPRQIFAPNRTQILPKSLETFDSRGALSFEYVSVKVII